MDHICFLFLVFLMHCCLVVTCWERADLLALVGDFYCIFVTFPCGVLGEVWYFIVSFPNLCRLSYSEWLQKSKDSLKICFKNVNIC